MTKQEVLSRYQERFADKTLSFGCRVYDDQLKIRTVVEETMNLIYDNGFPDYGYECTTREDYNRGILKTIGHPITYGRLYQKLYYIGNNSGVMMLMEKFRGLLLGNKLLDSTIYEWVENEECRKDLLELKDKLDG